LNSSQFSSLSIYISHLLLGSHIHFTYHVLTLSLKCLLHVDLFPNFKITTIIKYSYSKQINFNPPRLDIVQISLKTYVNIFPDTIFQTQLI